MSKSKRQKKTKVLVWIPLRPGASWRGEGIAQTVENILIHTNGSVEYTIVCSQSNVSQLTSCLRESGKDLSHIKVSSMSLFQKSDKSDKSTEKWLTAHVRHTSMIGGYFGRKYRNLVSKFSMSLSLWGGQLFFHALLQRLALKYRGFDAIWFPTPLVPFISFLRGRKVTCFWDPFVMEYTRFSNATTVCKLIYSALSQTDRVITQSNSNARYLVDVMGLAREKIAVVYNGSPDYGSYVSTANVASPRHLISYLKQENPRKKVTDFINYSVFNRLLGKLTEQTRVILISTQARLYKGFDELFEILNFLVKNHSDQYDFQFIITAGEIPETLYQKYYWSNEKIHNIARVNPVFHAHLYRFSHLLLHPSYVEGGLGSYPQYEAASVGCPSLNNDGRHMRELAAYFGEDLSEIVSDFFKVEETAQRVMTILSDSEKQKNNIALTNRLRFEWAESANFYDQIFLEVSNNNVA